MDFLRYVLTTTVELSANHPLLASIFWFIIMGLWRDDFKRFKAVKTTAQVYDNKEEGVHVCQ